MNKNTPIEINAKGGQGSVTHGGFHLGFPAKGALEVAHVVKEGASRYSVNNWRRVTPEDHINHAIEHLFILLDPTGDHSENHLAHAACRLLMALDTRIEGQPYQWETGVDDGLRGVGH